MSTHSHSCRIIILLSFYSLPVFCIVSTVTPSQFMGKLLPCAGTLWLLKLDATVSEASLHGALQWPPVEPMTHYSWCQWPGKSRSLRSCPTCFHFCGSFNIINVAFLALSLCDPSLQSYRQNPHPAWCPLVPYLISIWTANCCFHSEKHLVDIARQWPKMKKIVRWCRTCEQHRGGSIKIA